MFNFSIGESGSSWLVFSLRKDIHFCRLLIRTADLRIMTHYTPEESRIV